MSIKHSDVIPGDRMGDCSVYAGISPDTRRTMYTTPADAPLTFTFKPRRRNLWVTDTLQWAPEARLAQPANPMWDSAASAFPVRSQLAFELVCPLR